MGLNIESINKSAKSLNMTPDQVLEMMLKDFYAAEPFDFDDPIMHTADIRLSDEDEKRYNATISKRWLIDIGYFDTNTAE